MAKLDWQKQYKKGTTLMSSEYYSNPKTGFDRHWHEKQANKKAKQPAPYKAKPQDKQKQAEDRLIRDKAMAMIRANKLKKQHTRLAGQK